MTSRVFDNLALVSFLALFPGVVLSVDAHTGHLHVLHLCDVLHPLPTGLTTFCQDPFEPLISHAVVTHSGKPPHRSYSPLRLGLPPSFSMSPRTYMLVYSLMAYAYINVCIFYHLGVIFHEIMNFIKTGTVSFIFLLSALSLLAFLYSQHLA